MFSKTTSSSKGESIILYKATSIYIALLFSVFLLAVPAAGYVAIAEFKYVLFLLICGGYCVLVVFLRIQLAVTGIQPVKNIFEHVKDIPLVAKLLFIYMFASMLSAVFSVYGGTFLGYFRHEGFFTILIYVCSCFFVSMYFRPKKWMIFLLGGSVCLFCLLAFVQLTGANPFTLFPYGQSYYGAGVYFPGEFISTTGNAGLGGAFLSLVAGVFLMVLVKYDFDKKWILAMPLFLVVLLIFEMNINAALLAFAVGVVLVLPVAVLNRGNLVNFLILVLVVVSAFAVSQFIAFGDGTTLFNFLPMVMPLVVAVFILAVALVIKKVDFFTKISALQYRRVAIFAVVSVSVIALIYVALLGNRHTGMVFEASEVLQGRPDDSFGTRRIYIWRNVLERIKPENILLGTGPDTLGFWDIPPFTRFSEELGVILMSRIDAAHNEYLHIFATKGIFALLSYLGAIIVVLVQWFRLPNNSLLAVAGAGVLFYSIQAFFGISMPIVAPYFWACLGIFIYSQKIVKSEVGA